MEQKKTLPKNQTWFRDGAMASWPICFGYIPIGLALGVLANQAEIPTWAVAMMSILVFAGSAQFICVAMLAAGAGIWAIIFTTFVVNLRHFLMSSAVAVYLRGLQRMFLSFFAYGITDESFAVNMTHFRKGNWDHKRAITVNQLANMAWITSTVCGALIGQFIPTGAFGTDYALTAMFLALLLFQLHDAVYVLTGLTALGIATAWYLLIPGDSYIIGSSVLAASIGFFFKRYREKKR
ncbi:MAG TPA: branched-chain amino acid ABC transporter permease [Desulfocapsa sulfexigens]|nr:branched-chain amino acid ABC transporter permease [Desulfocapsa sulfexigens]HIQ37158.1 branched-chain amino acid ABC transporter permease [Desulfocapsa sulfexigens]